MTFEEWWDSIRIDQSVPNTYWSREEACRHAWIAATKNALETAAKKFDGKLPHDWVCADGYSNGFDIADELREMADRYG